MMGTTGSNEANKTPSPHVTNEDGAFMETPQICSSIRTYCMPCLDLFVYKSFKYYFTFTPRYYQFCPLLIYGIFQLLLYFHSSANHNACCQYYCTERVPYLSHA